jgi:hypothetical protein
MNKILIYILILSQLLLISCAAKPKHTQIDIGECKIPIFSNLKQTTFKEKYRYHFSTKITPENFYDKLKSIDIYKKNSLSPEQFIKKTQKKDSSLKLIKKFKNSNFTIIQYSSSGLENEFNYIVYLNSTIVQFINSSEEEVNYLINYCQNNKIK